MIAPLLAAALACGQVPVEKHLEAANRHITAAQKQLGKSYRIVNDAGETMGILSLKQGNKILSLDTSAEPPPEPPEPPEEPFTAIAGGLSSYPDQILTDITPDNSGFEDDWSDWTVDSQEQFTITTDEAYEGTHSLWFDGSKATSGAPVVTCPLEGYGAGTYILSFKYKVTDLEPAGTSTAGVRVGLRYKNTETGAWVGTYEPRIDTSTNGEWVEAEVTRVVLDHIEEDTLHVYIARLGTTASGDLYLDDFEVINDEAPPVELWLDYPNFRGYIHRDMSQTVKARVTINKANPSGEVSLVITDKDGATVDSETTGIEDGDVVEFDATSWANGEYHIAASLDGYTYPYWILIKLSAADSAALKLRFNEDHVAIVDGEPYLPLTLYTTSKFYSSAQGYLDSHVQEMADEVGIKGVLNYHQQAASFASQEAYCDALAQNDMQYIYCMQAMLPNVYYADDKFASIVPESPTGVFEDWEYGEIFIRRMMTGVFTEENDNIFAIYAMDEREETYTRLYNQFYQYNIIRELAPGVPTLMIDINPLFLDQWALTCDIVGTDPYPLVRNSDDTPLSRVGNYTRECVEKVNNTRPVWITMQWYKNYSGDVWPTEDQTKIMALMAITEGARGFQWWSWGYRGLYTHAPEDPLRAEYTARLKVTIDLMKSLEDWILASDDDDAVLSVGIPSLPGLDASDLHYVARTVSTRTYVFYYLAGENRSDIEGDAVDIVFNMYTGDAVEESIHFDEASYFYVDDD